MSFSSFFCVLLSGVFCSLAAPLFAQTTPAEWQAKALKSYPALGEKGSPFNTEFVRLYQEKKSGDPAFIQQVDWPWQLAAQVAATLGVSAVDGPETAPEAIADAAAPIQEPAPAVPAEAAADQSGEWERADLPAALGMEFAKFRWWAPGGVKLRGILVLVPGRGGDGRGMADNAKWQAIARAQHFGIVACFLKNRADTPFAYQGDPNGATSALLNEAISKLQAEYGHGKAELPLFFYGHSAGGNVSQRYGNVFAKRMIGAVIMRCPSGPGDYHAPKGDVPMLIYIGGKDKKEWVDYSLERYREGQGKRAVWTLAMRPDEGHGVGNTWELTEAFVNEVIALRLGAVGPGSTASPKKLSRQQGWLGDPESFEVAPASQFKGKKQTATWLPNEAAAAQWRLYLSH